MVGVSVYAYTGGSLFSYPGLHGHVRPIDLESLMPDTDILNTEQQSLLIVSKGHIRTPANLIIDDGAS